MPRQVERAAGRAGVASIAAAVLLLASAGGAPAAVERHASMTSVLAADAPAALPGTRSLTVEWWRAAAWSNTPGVTIVVDKTGTSAMYAHLNGGGSIIVPLDLPAGAVVRQIDVYGYRATTGDQHWWLANGDATTGGWGALLAQATVTGSGILHAKLTPSNAEAFAIGHVPMLVTYPADGPGAGFVGAVVQYSLPQRTVLVPISPVRVYDSRCSGAGGPLVAGHPRTISVKDGYVPTACTLAASNAVPAGAVAISYNLTVTATKGAGFVDLLPGASTTVTGSSINWSAAGTTIANGGIVSVGSGAADRKVTLVLAGSGTPSAQVIVDVTGYYISES